MVRWLVALVLAVMLAGGATLGPAGTPALARESGFLVHPDDDPGTTPGNVPQPASEPAGTSSSDPTSSPATSPPTGPSARDPATSPSMGLSSGLSSELASQPATEPTGTPILAPAELSLPADPILPPAGAQAPWLDFDTLPTPESSPTPTPRPTPDLTLSPILPPRAAAPLVRRGTSGTRPRIAITIDDAYSPESVEADLELLLRLGVNATFFPIGRVVALNPDLWRRVASAGFPIANHTWSHTDLTKLSEPAIETEIRKASAIITSVTGRPPAPFMRPMGGAWNQSVLVAAGRAGQAAVVLWDVTSGDTGRGTVQDVVNNSIRATNGTILLHHANDLRTPLALEIEIGHYRQLGYEFVTLGQLLGVPGPVPFVEAPPPPPAPTASTSSPEPASAPTSEQSAAPEPASTPNPTPTPEPAAPAALEEATAPLPAEEPIPAKGATPALIPSAAPPETSPSPGALPATGSSRGPSPSLGPSSPASLEPSSQPHPPAAVSALRAIPAAAQRSASPGDDLPAIDRWSTPPAVDTRTALDELRRAVSRMVAAR